MAVFAANMYFSSLILKKFDDMIKLIANPENIAIPPSVGTICLDAERWFGTSNIFFTLDILTILGITKYTIVKLIARLKNKYR
jgi:hypothetical protein